MDPFSPLKESDVAIVKKMLNDSHKVFINHVKSNRKEKLQGTDEELFNGAIWTGEPALKLGLIDGIDTMDNYIIKKYGDQVKVNRIKSKYQELAELFGGKSKISISDMLHSQNKNILS